MPYTSRQRSSHHSTQDFAEALRSASTRHDAWVDAAAAALRNRTPSLLTQLLDAPPPPHLIASIAHTATRYQSSDEQRKPASETQQSNPDSVEIIGSIGTPHLVLRRQLQARRRAIALLHHPDRAPEALRKSAEERMKSENALIDQLLLNISDAQQL